jgi:hypothetical protein
METEPVLAAGAGRCLRGARDVGNLPQLSL